MLFFFRVRPPGRAGDGKDGLYTSRLVLTRRKSTHNADTDTDTNIEFRCEAILPPEPTMDRSAVRVERRGRLRGQPRQNGASGAGVPNSKHRYHEDGHDHDCL